MVGAFIRTSLLRLVCILTNFLKSCITCELYNAINFIILTHTFTAMTESTFVNVNVTSMKMAKMKSKGFNDNFSYQPHAVRYITYSNSDLLANN